MNNQQQNRIRDALQVNVTVREIPKVCVVERECVKPGWPGRRLYCTVRAGTGYIYGTTCCRGLVASGTLRTVASISRWTENERISIALTLFVV